MDLSYWLAKIDNPQKVILSPEDIQTMNQQGLEMEPPLLFDLASYKNPVAGSTVSDLITQFDSIDEPLTTPEGTLSDDAWKALLLERNLDVIATSVQPRYGVVVSRGDLRLWPTSNFEDQPQQSGILPGEPIAILHETADASWLFVTASYCVGWIQAADVATFATFEEWNNLVTATDFYLCCADRTVQAVRASDKTPIAFDLFIGEKLLRASAEEWKKSDASCSAMGRYLVKRFIRSANGMCTSELIGIPLSAPLSHGYAPYSIEHVLSAAWSMLGDPYSWGGWKHGRDCSEYTLRIFQCFGILLPRDSTPQSKMPFKRTEFDDGASLSDKETALRATRPGSLLEFPGHIMIYLGESQGSFYVISDAGTFALSAEEEPLDVSSVLINTLDVVRPNGKTWMESLRTISHVEPA